MTTSKYQSLRKECHEILVMDVVPRYKLLTLLTLLTWCTLLTWFTLFIRSTLFAWAEGAEGTDRADRADRAEGNERDEGDEADKEAMTRQHCRLNICCYIG